MARIVFGALSIALLSGGLASLGNAQDAAQAGPAIVLPCADWQLITDTQTPEYNQDTPQGPKTQTSILGSVTAIGIAWVSAGPDQLTGEGSASDWDLGTDMFVNAIATGIRHQVWEYLGPDQGRVTVEEALVQIDGKAELIDDDCAALALGFSEFECDITAPKLIRATLKKSAGETVEEKLTDLTGAYRGLEISIPVTVSRGEGTYPDSDRNATSGQSEINFFSFKHRTRGHIQCYANVGVFDPFDFLAKCKADLGGSVHTRARLECVPRKEEESGDDSSGEGETPPSEQESPPNVHSPSH